MPPRQIALLALVAVIPLAAMETSAAAVGAVHAPGLAGEATCLTGVELGADQASAPVTVLCNGSRFSGTAYPDRAAIRVLVKLTKVVESRSDGTTVERDVDAYLQDPSDGLPGLRVEFSTQQNALMLKSDAHGRLILLRSLAAK